ncbi:undecaprenyl-diphosphate phosphatase [Geobacter grbiciae]|uniref:undecaprenyl-diphosphate phosphatase n=1 Tax=Geobacter grbiciae TaxID=155042 RepID=UPI001C033DD3|nr:undecaprenyl-diphosphate phosphatase [Geobacter grbiciae]MBT1074818.1 undecaprenyl-diphosphate phosphatase [Geobacter grbiciae]
MNPLHATVLGAIQGLTEVLPVSSSAHLILIPWLFGWPESGITFDVALHLGTLIALALYFRRDIAELVVNALSGLTGGAHSSTTLLPWYIIAGCVPAAIVGKTLEEPIEAIFRANPAIIAAFLIGFGLLLALADTLGSKKSRMDQIDLKNAMMIGLAQCLALLPGVSRSGITITAALFLGFSRETAARFSFLLSLPIVAGAALLKVGHLVRHGVPEGELQPLLIGVGVSAVFGYVSVALLLKLVQRYSLYPFVWYRLLAGAGVLLFIFNQ